MAASFPITERQKKKLKKLDCKFNRINSDEEGFDIGIDLRRIQTYIIK